MSKRACCLLLAALVVFALAGCGPLSFQNTDELLRAPALGQQQGEIQKALSASLGQELQYKFPKEGGVRYPVVLADLNGDGLEEGIALYSLADKSTSVYVAVLEQQDGKWALTQDVKGTNNDVASLDVVDLLGDGTKQLVVGFSSSNLTNKSLLVYQYKDQTLAQLYPPLPYSRYTLVDFPGEGGRGIALATPVDQAMQLTYLPTRDGAFQPAQAPVTVGLNYEACVGLATSEGPDGSHLLVVDAMVSENLASQLVYFSGDHFYVVDDGGVLQKDTVRANRLLTSRDIDGDGIVEIPLRIGEISTLDGDKRLEFIEWKDFISADKTTKQYGILDSDRSIYVRLPDDWRGRISVKDGVDPGEWLVEDKDNNQVLLRLVTMEPGEAPPMGALPVPGLSSAYLVLRSGLTNAERAGIAVTSLA